MHRFSSVIGSDHSVARPSMHQSGCHWSSSATASDVSDYCRRRPPPDKCCLRKGDATLYCTSSAERGGLLVATRWHCPLRTMALQLFEAVEHNLDEKNVPWVTHGTWKEAASPYMGGVIPDT
eukprot:4072521-Pleurochrysis_carterae.AAC.3